jgi:hypothetical protein
LLPEGYVALTDQQAGGLIPHVLTLRWGPQGKGRNGPAGGVMIESNPPSARLSWRANRRFTPEGPTGSASSIAMGE